MINAVFKIDRNEYIMSNKDTGWLSSVSDQPPDHLLDSDGADAVMEVDENSDSMNQSMESSVASSPPTTSLSIKNYASTNMDKSNNKKNNIDSFTGNTESKDDSDASEKSNVKEKKRETHRKVDSEPITPVIRRSSRANKGIGKEIFDPSHIPASQKRFKEPKRFDSPNTERSSSPSSSSQSSPNFRKRRIVIGESPTRRVNKNDNQLKKKKKEEKKLKRAERGRPREPKKSPKEKKQLKTLKTQDDFSDDDDNVPLKLLKEDEVSEQEENDHKESNKEENSDAKNHRNNTKDNDNNAKSDVNDATSNKEDTDSDTDSDSDSGSDSDDSYNNPQRLWCICRKPHNNRFMISCDNCEDWYHGDCVGISLERGRKMEENNEEYICPKCSKKQYYRDDSYKPESKENKPRRKSTDENEAKSHKRSTALDEKLKSRKTLKGYALFGQIQSASGKDGTKKIDKSTWEANVSADQVKKVSKKAQSEVDSKSSSRKCIVASCDADALPGSVYCSNQCILKHAKESLMYVVKDKEKEKAKKSAPGAPKALNPNRRISVICRKTRKVLTGPAAPRRKDLAAFLKKYPRYKVYRPPPSSGDKPEPTSNVGKPAPARTEEGKGNTTDFYKHVESQHRKRDRYGAEPEHAPHARKPSDSSSSSMEKKHRVIKLANQSAPTFLKSNDASKPSNPYYTNKHKHSSHNSERSSSLSLKHSKSNPETTKRQDGAKSSERRSSKDQKRKHSIDKEDRAPKKVERSPSSGSKSKQEAKTNTGEVRQNIKKSLFDILKHRSENSEDLKMHPDSIMRLAAKIEDSLFKVYNETSMKYKNKYRSMMFNLKDTRNHGLWRKVIIGEVTTAEFVQMTAEQMASKKLAEWRKNELTQELDIIKKQEKEIANIRPVAKITHKGEIAIQEDLSDMTENFSNRENTSAPTIAPIRKKRISLSEDDPFIASVSSHASDTTSQHQDHLFDLNCKICTGKVKEEDMEQPETPKEDAKKVKRSTSIILSTEAQHASSSAEKNSTPTSHIVISEKPRHSKKKKKKEEMEEVESNINSHDPSLSPTSFLSNLLKEKKKKPILPAPPPLSDITDRNPEPEIPPEEPDDVKEEETKSKIEDVEKPTTSPETTSTTDPPPKTTTSKLIWSGSISMLELSTFKSNVYPANGCCDNLDIDLPVRLVLGGRIHPKVVWDYLGKISVLPTKQLSVVRFHAASDDDRVGYVAMLSYFSSRKRFGVVSNQDRMLVKDMYLIPLLESHPVPDQLAFCSPGIKDSLPPNRPSMLLGIVVRQISVKPTKPIVAAAKSTSTTIQQRSPVEKPTTAEDEEEYIPDENPPLKERTLSPAPLLTDEELAAKSSMKPQSSGSLLERNRSLAPSLRFFMRKQSEEEQNRRELEGEKDDDRPYSPGEDIAKEEEDNGGDYDPEDGIDQGEDDEEDDDDEAYDPEKMYEEEEEYDPETAFASLSPKGDDNIPYDPEDAEELIKDSMESSEVKELVEKQAFIERMQRELEEKKAKLAQVEQSLQQSAPAPATTAPPVEKPRIVDPRLARRAAAQEPEKANPEAPKVSAVTTSTVTSAPDTSISASSTISTKPTAVSASLSTNISSAVTSNIPSAGTEVSANSQKNSSIPEVKKVDTVEVTEKPTDTQTVKKPESPKATEKADPPKPLDSLQTKPVDPLQTILSVLNMAQQKGTSTTSSMAGALKIFQKQSSPPPLPDSTTKSDPEDAEGGDSTKKDSNVLVDYAPSPDSRHGDDDLDKKKSKKNDQKRRRSSSASSSSSHEDSRRRHRHDYDDKRHSKRHRRSRSRSPHRRPRHHRRHDDHHRRSWSRDKRR